MISPKVSALLQNPERDLEHPAKFSRAVHFEFVLDRKILAEGFSDGETESDSIQFSSQDLSDIRVFEGQVANTHDVDLKAEPLMAQNDEVEDVEDNSVEQSLTTMIVPDLSYSSAKIMRSEGDEKNSDAADSRLSSIEPAQMEQEVSELIVNEFLTSGNTKETTNSIAFQRPKVEMGKASSFEIGHYKNAPSTQRVDNTVNSAMTINSDVTSALPGLASATATLDAAVLVRVQSRGDLLLGVAQPIAVKLSQRPTDGVQRLSLQMQPDGLGQLNIKMQKNNGRLGIIVEAQNDTISRTLTQDVDILKTAIRSLLPDLTHLEIQVSREQNGQSQSLSSASEGSTNEKGADGSNSRGFMDEAESSNETEINNVEIEKIVTSSRVTI